MDQKIEVGDEVIIVGQNGRFVVLALKGGFAVLQLFGNNGSGKRIYWKATQEAPTTSLGLLGKNHKRPQNALYI